MHGWQTVRLYSTFWWQLWEQITFYVLRNDFGGSCGNIYDIILMAFLYRNPGRRRVGWESTGCPEGARWVQCRGCPQTVLREWFITRQQQKCFPLRCYQSLQTKEQDVKGWRCSPGWSQRTWWGQDQGECHGSVWILSNHYLYFHCWIWELFEKK